MQKLFRLVLSISFIWTFFSFVNDYLRILKELKLQQQHLKLAEELKRKKKVRFNKWLVYWFASYSVVYLMLNYDRIVVYLFYS